MKRFVMILLVLFLTVSLLTGCRDHDFRSATVKPIPNDDSVYMKIAIEYTAEHMDESAAEMKVHPIAEEAKKSPNVGDLRVKYTDSDVAELTHVADINGYKLYKYIPRYLPDDQDVMQRFAAGAWTLIDDGWWEDRAPKYLVFTGGGEELSVLGVFRCEFTPDGNSEMFYRDFNKYIFTHTGNPEAELIDRMLTVWDTEPICIFATFDNIDREALVKALNNAAWNYIVHSDIFRDYYSMEVHFSPESHFNDADYFILSAGLEENVVRVQYFRINGLDQWCFFENKELYELVRNNFTSGGSIDSAVYEPYREIIEARAQKTVDEELNMKGKKAYTGYEILDFQQIDTITLPEYTYDVYKWNVAFTTDDPDTVVWAGGMYLDSEARARAVDGYTYFVVKTDKNGNKDHRFLFWSLYQGPDEETGRENAIERIENEFQK